MSRDILNYLGGGQIRSAAVLAAAHSVHQTGLQVMAIVDKTVRRTVVTAD